jgi:hypothetical protein
MKKMTIIYFNMTGEKECRHIWAMGIDDAHCQTGCNNKFIDAVEGWWPGEGLTIVSGINWESATVGI